MHLFDQTQVQLELYCPRCQQCQICTVALSPHPFPEEGWSDSPASINFYQVTELKTEGSQQIIQNRDAHNNRLAQCPRCSYCFTLKDGQINSQGPAPFALSQTLNWEETYRALETQRFSKKQEFQIRMGLWRRANDERRVPFSLESDLWDSTKLLLKALLILFSMGHLKVAALMAFAGFLMGLLSGHNWQEIAHFTATFASFPSLSFAFILCLITPMVFQAKVERHLNAYHARRKWRQKESLYCKNLMILLPFLDENKALERLIKAEGHRQLGQFKEALILIEQGLPETVSNYSFMVGLLSQIQDSSFDQSKFFTEDVDINDGICQIL